jgi:hypothetical protein
MFNTSHKFIGRFKYETEMLFVVKVSEERPGLEPVVGISITYNAAEHTLPSEAIHIITLF